jgi:hypothetical protein
MTMGQCYKKIYISQFHGNIVILCCRTILPWNGSKLPWKFFITLVHGGKIKYDNLLRYFKCSVGKLLWHFHNIGRVHFTKISTMILM